MTTFCSMLMVAVPEGLPPLVKVSPSPGFDRTPKLGTNSLPGVGVGRSDRFPTFANIVIPMLDSSQCECYVWGRGVKNGNEGRENKRTAVELCVQHTKSVQRGAGLHGALLDGCRGGDLGVEEEHGREPKETIIRQPQRQQEHPDLTNMEAARDNRTSKAALASLWSRRRNHDARTRRGFCTRLARGAFRNRVLSFRD